MTNSLCFYYKTTTNFDISIVNNANFRSFKYKAKLFGNTDAGGANGILRNTAINVPYK